MTRFKLLTATARLSVIIATSVLAQVIQGHCAYALRPNLDPVLHARQHGLGRGASVRAYAPADSGRRVGADVKPADSTRRVFLLLLSGAVSC